MKTLIFDFYNLSHKDTAIGAAKRAFARAGATVATVDVAAKTQRTSGIDYRNVQFGFSDSQTVSFGVNATGDVAQIKVNGKAVPVKNQDDQGEAIKEVVAMMTAGRTKFQSAMAKAKVALPATIRTAAPKIEAVWREKIAGLDEAISEASEKLADLQGSGT